MYYMNNIGAGKHQNQAASINLTNHFNKAAEEIKAMVAAKLAEKEAAKVETVTETKATANKSKVCVIANSLKGMNRSEAFRKAWAIVKAETVETKVAGVTVGNRQKALEHLTRYEASEISVSLERETANEYDANAIAVIVAVANKGKYTIGYIPATLAKVIAPLMDAQKAVRATFKEIRGKYQTYHNYGLAVSVSI